MMDEMIDRHISRAVGPEAEGQSSGERWRNHEREGGRGRDRVRLAVSSSQGHAIGHDMQNPDQGGEEMRTE